MKQGMHRGWGQWEGRGWRERRGQRPIVHQQRATPLDQREWAAPGEISPRDKVAQVVKNPLAMQETWV